MRGKLRLIFPELTLGQLGALLAIITTGIFLFFFGHSMAGDLLTFGTLIGVLIWLFLSIRRRNVFSERLEQVDFLLDQGFWEEAETYLQELLELFPEQKTSVHQARQRVVLVQLQQQREEARNAEKFLDDFGERIQGSRVSTRSEGNRTQQGDW